MFNKIRTAVVTVAAAGTMGLGLVGATAASAAPAVVPHDSTASCQVQPGCNEPVVAIAQGGGASQDFTQSFDAALTVQSPNGRPSGAGDGTPVYTRINNGLDNGLQDFSFNFVGIVPPFGSGSAGDFNFTQFDRFHYGHKPLVQEEWTPFGQGTNLCVNIGVRSHLASLQACNSLHKGQVFILTRYGTNLLPPADSAYSFVLNVRHQPNLSQHQLLTADDSGFGRVSVQDGVTHSPGAATPQMWSALP